MKPSLRLLSLLILGTALLIHFSVPATILLPLWASVTTGYAVVFGLKRRFILLLPFIIVLFVAFLVPLPLPDTWTPVQKLVTLISGWTIILIILSLTCLIYLSPEERDS